MRRFHTKSDRVTKTRTGGYTAELLWFQAILDRLNIHIGPYRSHMQPPFEIYWCDSLSLTLAPEDHGVSVVIKV